MVRCARTFAERDSRNILLCVHFQDVLWLLPWGPVVANLIDNSISWGTWVHGRVYELRSNKGKQKLLDLCEKFRAKFMELRRSGFFFPIWMKPISGIGPIGELELDHLEVDKISLENHAKAVLGKYLFGKMAFENFLHGNAWVTMFEKWTKKLIPPNIFFQILEVILRIWFPLCGDLVWKRAKISFKVAVGRRKKADVFHKSGFEDILAGGSRCWWIFYTFYWSCRRQQWQRHIQRLSNKLFTEYFTLLYLLLPSPRKDTEKSFNQIVMISTMRIWEFF